LTAKSAQKPIIFQQLFYINHVNYLNGAKSANIKNEKNEKKVKIFELFSIFYKKVYQNMFQPPYGNIFVGMQ